MELLSSPSAPTRFVATHFLVQSIWSSAIRRLVDVLGDPDMNVARRALDVFGTDMTKSVDGEKLFGQLEQLMARLPKRSRMLTSPVWPWWSRKFEKADIASAMSMNAAAVPGERLLPYVPDLQPAARAAFVRRISNVPSRWQRKPEGAEEDEFSATERTVLLDLMGDASGDVRVRGTDALRDLPAAARGRSADRATRSQSG